MFVYEQIAFAAVFSWKLARRERCGRAGLPAGILLVVMGGLLWLSSIMQENGQLPEIASNRLLSLASAAAVSSLIFLLVTVLLHAWYDISGFEAVYAMTCAYLGEHIAYCLRILLEAVTGLPVTGGGIWWLYLAVNIGVAFLCYHLFAVPMIHRAHYTAPPRETIAFLLAATLVIMVLSILSDLYGFRAIHAVYALIFCFFLLYTQVERQGALARQSEADVREQMWISQKAQYENYRVSTDLINRKCHDLKHQVEALRVMGRGENQERAIREIEDSVLFYDSFLKTGNEGLDTILTQKNLLCTEKKILFTCVADGKLLDFMDPVDLFVFFGNLMDNAIEAVEILPEEQRSIQLSVSEKAGMVIVREENPTAHGLRTEEGRTLTTKADQDSHGFGLRSMEIAAEKYDGTLSYRVEGGVFLLSAVFLQ